MSSSMCSIWRRSYSTSAECRMEEEMLLRRRPLTVRAGRSTDGATARGDEEEVEQKGGGWRGSSSNIMEAKVEEEPLSPAARLFHEPHFNCYIIAIMGSGKAIDVNLAKPGLEATILRHPRFSSVQVLDENGGKKASWVPVKVNVEDHIVIPDLDAANSTSPDQMVEDYVSSLSRTAMDLSRPLWDFHILNVPTSEAAAVAVFRVHHSLGDGTSLMSLLMACFRKTSDPDALPTLPEPQRLPAKPGVGRFTFISRLWAFLVLAWNTVFDVAHFIATATFLKDTPTPIRGTEGVEFRPRRFVHRTVSFDDVKAVKNALNCTINDVFVGVTSAGLSRYVYRRYEESGTKVPRSFRVRSTLLVNIRPTPGIRAMSELMEGKSSGAKWGNFLGYLLVPFPIVKYSDPLDYIHKGKAIVDRKKNSLEAVITHRSADLVLKCFGIKAAADLSYRVLSNTTLSFSNIAGPLEEINIFGHPLVYLAPTVYGQAHALTINYLSYVNKLKIVLAVDELAIPDPHQLLDDFAESLELIKEAATKKI